MNIKSDYADFDTLPCDWSIRSLEQLFDKGFQNGLFFENARKGKGVPIVNVSDLYGALPIKLEILEKFDATDEEIRRFLVHEGDLFFTRSSIVPEGIAMCNVYSGKTEDNSVFDSHVVRLSINQEEINSLFLGFQCRMPYSRRFFIANSKTAIMTTIDQKAISQCPIPVPSLSEQVHIVETIKTFDAYIDDLAELIEKKRGIRDGALENLIVGRTRIAGFYGEWKEYAISDITKTVITGGTPSTARQEYYGGNIPWLSSTEIHQKRIKTPTTYITDLGLKNSSAKMAPERSVLIALAGQGKTRGTAAYLMRPMALNQSLAALVTNEKCNPEFLYYLIESMYLPLRDLSSGDGGRGGLNKKLIKGISVTIPIDVVEQKAIADTLTAMDEEIEALENERDKMIQIREGAMDDLLTGRIRLKA